MSNRSEGEKFEREVLEFLGKCGFWAHRFAQNADGQPADIIALDGSARPYLIDCKVCRGDLFSLKRIEPNQWSAMQKGEAHGMDAMFVIKSEVVEDWRYIEYRRILGLYELGVSSIKVNKLEKFKDLFRW